MSKFSGVLLASDIDGTLLRRNGALSPKNQAALAYFMQNGGHFTLATGRSYLGVRSVMAEAAVNAPVILSNGAMLYDYAADSIVFKEVLTSQARQMAHVVLERFPRIGLEMLYQDKKFVINRGLAVQLHFHFVKIRPEEGIDVQSPDDVPGEWYKILICDLPQYLHPVGDWLMHEYGTQFEICYSASTLLEIQNKGTNKSAGLRRLGEHCGIAPEHIYCAGDNQNDLSMLRDYHGFAPANAVPECKSAAAAIGPSCEEDFMAFVIEGLDRRYS